MKAVFAIAALSLAGSVQAAPALSPQAVVAAKFEAVNRHAVDEIAAFYAPDAEITAPDFCAPRHGRADVERTYRALFAAVPDASVEVLEYVADGDRVAVRMKVVSRLPDRAFSASLTDFFTVRDGLIVRDDGMFDNRGRPCTP
ncbi:MAG: nuclear transport factor 2 family protein [Proteobacteria bacterium]|nr:nuclear transport factor 2 family protein [Pseudomonadota bacterium]